MGETLGRDEAFQPIPVRAPEDAPVRFALRCAVDLQLLTIHRFLQGRLSAMRGRVLDVGAGEAPWRGMLGDVDYVGVDVESADAFGMPRKADLIYYDGRVLPFADASFDHVLSVEVLEHVESPENFVAELARVLKAGGSLVLTVPWSARLHHLPNDHHRFTHFRLRTLLATAGFRDVDIAERGNDVAVVANKLIVMAIGLLGSRGMGRLWRWPMAVVLAPVAVVFTAAAHVSIRFGLGSRLDPLGYGVTAIRA